MLHTVDVPWLKTDETGAPLDPQAEILGRAYQYILSDEWGKGTPVPWVSRKAVFMGDNEI